MFGNILIIGYGLIGASLEDAIKNRWLLSYDTQVSIVTGKNVNLTEFPLSEHYNVFQTIEDLDFEDVNYQDLIILASPAETYANILSHIKPFLHKDTLLIDVASTKSSVVELAIELDINLIPCHPLCGSEKSGYKNRIPSLFENSKVIITPLCNQDYSKIVEFWESLGSIVTIMDVVEHDDILAYTSHLPHVISFAYRNVIINDYIQYGAGSYNDLTRCCIE